jgi:hypothetical protein
MAAFVLQQLEGSFTDASTLSGTSSAEAVTYQCSDGNTIPTNPQKGTWRGSIGG